MSRMSGDFDDERDETGDLEEEVDEGELDALREAFGAGDEDEDLPEMPDEDDEDL